MPQSFSFDLDLSAISGFLKQSLPSIELNKAFGSLTYERSGNTVGIDLSLNLESNLGSINLGPWNFDFNPTYLDYPAEPTPKIDQIIAFGDSLSDTGTLFQLTGGLVPPSPPYFEGRFSNGPIWIDYLADRFGLDDTAAQSFAVGGAKAGRDNISTEQFGLPASLNLPGTLDEIDAFTTQASPVADSNTLFVLWAGGNDLLNLPSDPNQAFAGIVNAVADVSKGIIELAQVGAEQILVPNSIDLGLAPFPRRNGLAEQATTASVIFNRLLDGVIPFLERGLGINVIEVDLFSVSQRVAANPGEFGFTNVTDPLIEQTTPVNPDEFFWWDQIHPTTRTHQIVADLFEASVAQSTPPNGSSTLFSADRLLKNAKAGLENLLPAANSKSLVPDSGLTV
jgi:phospholipase/lecithinase/hemolysin